MKLSTKAQNLDILKKLRLQKSIIPKFFKYSVEDWISHRYKIIKVLIWISPIFDETSFEIMKAKHQIKDNNKGSNATAIGIKNK